MVQLVEAESLSRGTCESGGESGMELEEQVGRWGEERAGARMRCDALTVRENGSRSKPRMVKGPYGSPWEPVGPRSHVRARQ